MLASVSRRIEREIRNMDYLFRWGGDEFVLLLPHTDSRDARKMGARIASVVDDPPIRIGGRGQAIRASVSFGVADIGQGGSPEALVQRASDECRVAKAVRREEAKSLSS